jgi:hypothetical protein
VQRRPDAVCAGVVAGSGQALAAQEPDATPARERRGFERQERLAGPGLAGDHHDAAGSRAEPLDALGEPRPLLGPPTQQRPVQVGGARDGRRARVGLGAQRKERLPDVVRVSETLPG